MWCSWEGKERRFDGDEGEPWLTLEDEQVSTRGLEKGMVLPVEKALCDKEGRQEGKGWEKQQRQREEELQGQQRAWIYCRASHATSLWLTSLTCATGHPHPLSMHVGL